MSRLITKEKIQIERRRVTLSGLKPIMFDRYAGNNDTKLEPWQKIYLKTDGETIILPSLNIKSFLSAHNTNSAPKRLMDARKFKKAANACLSFVDINPDDIPFLRRGEPIKFGKLNDSQIDQSSGIWIHRSVARLDKGIPNPKDRPVLPLPWDLSFELVLYPNSEITEQQIINLIDQGGRALGLGTFRGVFGKFEITEWEQIDE